MASGFVEDEWQQTAYRRQTNLWANISAKKLFKKIKSKTTQNILNEQHKIFFDYTKTGLYITLKNGNKEIAHISFHFEPGRSKGSQSHIKVGDTYFDLNFIINIESKKFDIEINHKHKDNFDKLKNKTLLTDFINRVRDIIKNEDETFADILTSRTSNYGTPGDRRKTKTRGAKRGIRLFDKYYYKYLKYKSKYLKLKNEMKKNIRNTYN